MAGPSERPWLGTWKPSVTIAKRSNSLNVFPLPDGDTGTNMLLTQQAVDGAVRDLQDAGLAEVGDAVVREALMRARGNSGVILSQVLRGLCGDGLDELDRVREAFAEAFPTLEVEVHLGGQPNYPLLIGLE
jgi:dihydroxyacetone kinase-like predicted kinase